ncbi:PepSY domain-containing protein [Ruegeria sp. AD91A]|uniref:PepSY domain-containing protein n=1 Tax=Ruegeria sp. AD91A TaxID=2293862 RepID=UPI0013C2E835|nr:PepSY domain-containing protein [Ruegeria sp. AD91A]
MFRSPILASFAVVMLLHSPAQAQVSVADDVIARIEAEGYTVEEVKRSWLGRIVITASDQNELREVVLNRTSGEVLRDQSFSKKSHGDRRPAPPANKPDKPSQPSEPNAHGGPKGGGGQGGKGKNGG